jgi:hypothetical protein
MQWFINYAFLALDCPIPVVYALICEKQLTKDDIHSSVLLGALLRRATAKYGVLPLATLDTFPLARNVYLFRLGDDYSVHSINDSAIWVSLKDKKEYAIQHTGEMPTSRIPLRNGHWQAQIEAEFNVFAARAIPASPSRDEST